MWHVSRGKNLKNSTDVPFKLSWLWGTLLKVLFYNRRVLLVAWSKWMPMEQLNTHHQMANQTSSWNRRGVQWKGMDFWCDLRPLTNMLFLTKWVRFLWALFQLGPDLEFIFKSSVFLRSLPSQSSPSSISDVIHQPPWPPRGCQVTLACLQQELCQAGLASMSPDPQCFLLAIFYQLTYPPTKTHTLGSLAINSHFPLRLEWSLILSLRCKTPLSYPPNLPSQSQIQPALPGEQASLTTFFFKSF